MTKRFNHLHKLAEIRRDIYVFPDSTDLILKNAIIQALPPTHKKVYEWLCSHGGNEPSSFVVAGWNMAHNQAADILRELVEFGLLERHEERNANGKRFIYTVAK